MNTRDFFIILLYVLFTVIFLFLIIKFSINGLQKEFPYKSRNINLKLPYVLKFSASYAYKKTPNSKGSKAIVNVYLYRDYFIYTNWYGQAQKFRYNPEIMSVDYGVFDNTINIKYNDGIIMILVNRKQAETFEDLMFRNSH